MGEAERRELNQGTPGLRLDYRGYTPPEGEGPGPLARRSVANPGELAYYVCYGSVKTALEELLKVAGTRWAIEECFEEAKGQVGLDQYELPRWDGWYRRGDAGPLLFGVDPEPGERALQWQIEGEPEWDEALIPLTLPEVRRLLYHLIWQFTPSAKSVLEWSCWRPRHQARSRLCHYKHLLTTCLRL